MFPALTGVFVQRRSHRAFLRVMHKDGAFAASVGHNGAGAYHTPLRLWTGPFVVPDAYLFRILRTHPDRLAATAQRQHVEVVVVLGVNTATLVVNGQVTHRHFGLSAAIVKNLAGRGFAIQVHEVHRRAEDGKLLAHFPHPVVIEEIVHATRERVPQKLDCSIFTAKAV